MRTSYRKCIKCIIVGINLSACAILPQPASPAPGVSVPSKAPPVSTALAQQAEGTPGLPQVDCKGNQLRISADDATLRSVLLALQKCLDVKIEIPASLDDQRSYIELGPGPTRQVLQDLLGSTDLNYALQPSDSDHEKIKSILLMTRQPDILAKNIRGTGAPNEPVSPAHRAWLESRKTGRHEQEESPSEEVPNRQLEVTKPLPQKLAGDPVVITGTTQVSTAPEVRDMSKIEDGTSAATKEPETVGESSAAPVPDPPNRGHNANEGKELENKIDGMQRLIEQRKRLNTDPTGASTVPPF